MGCASSRQARRDRRLSPAPYFRSRSMPVHHHHSKVGDSDRRHIVALTSSTLGSLRLDSDDEAMMKSANDDLAAGAGAKSPWAEMIESKIPKPRTPTKTPDPLEAETINAWELMEGLEEAAAAAPAVALHRSLSCSADSSPVPLWMQTPPPEDSIVSEFDPVILSNFRKALDELSPKRSPEFEEGIVKARVRAFQQSIDAKRGLKTVQQCEGPPNGEGKVVVYFTSLRGIRRTYEDCRDAKMILQAYGVRVDERDVSMHGGFKEELNSILGVGFGGCRLPRVFADGRYLGGAEEVRRMHESGELGRALEGCEAAAALAGKDGTTGVCEGCGGVRFVPCEICSGSCKVFVEEEEEEEEVVVGGGFRRCPECNENGLVRCTYCL